MVSNTNQGLLPHSTNVQLDDGGRDAEDSVVRDDSAEELFAKFLKVKGVESSNITSESSIKKKSKLCDLDKISQSLAVTAVTNTEHCSS